GGIASVGGGGSVAIVVVVIAFAIPLGSHRVVAPAIARVVAAPLEAVAIARVRRRRVVAAVAGHAAFRIVRVGRRGRIRRIVGIRRVVRAGVAVSVAIPALALVVAGLESLTVGAGGELG